jgi:HEAT repeat protein
MGYALSHDPALHALQLKVREYALAHEAEVLRVIKTSSDPKQRQMAANTLGYARSSSRQIAALVRAARDPAADVRNDAIRALGVLASADSMVGRQIPAESFIDMINSGIWTDRNKGSFVVMELTRARDPRLLAALRAKALDSLIEMAKWRSTGHGIPARVVLGRIANLPEEHLLELAVGPLQPILDALPQR